MEPTRRSSTDVPAWPTITYTGRLSDSRKGVDLFLDALEHLWSGPVNLGATVWIIGGDNDEVRRVRISALARPHVRSYVEKNAIVFWGRVDHASLPEFYSRSTVLVVPSFREQFGMVAVEAMMCGCPVVAARVGGLTDLVVAGRTGVLFDRGNPAALAACLSCYLVSPELAAWQGKNASSWARDRFALRRVLPLLEGLLTGAEIPPHDDYSKEAERAFLDKSIAGLTVQAEQMLASASVSSQDLTSSQSISFRLNLENGQCVFVKQYSRRPTFLSSIHGANPSAPDNAVYRLKLLQGLADQEYLPPILGVDEEHGLVVQQWIASTHEVGFTEAMSVVHDLCGEVAASRVLSREALNEFARATSPLAAYDLLELNSSQLVNFDRLAAQLQSVLHGGVAACKRMHPQIELCRIASYLSCQRTWLPGDYSVRALAEVRRLLRMRRYLSVEPSFAHGSLKCEHILAAADRYYLCDFDHAGYYVGPMDIAHLIWHHWENDALAGRTSKLGDLLFEHISDETDSYLAACWLLAYRLNKDLVFLTRGDWSILVPSMDKLWRFGDSLSRFKLFS